MVNLHYQDITVAQRTTPTTQTGDGKPVVSVTKYLKQEIEKHSTIVLRHFESGEGPGDEVAWK